MFSLLQKKVVSQKVEFEPAAMPEVKKPNQALDLWLSQAAVLETEKKEFNCLNDVFGELIDDEVSYALSKW